MPRRNEITEIQIAELQKAKKENKDKNKDRRLKALLLHAEGKSHTEISTVTGYAKTYITELTGKYCRQEIEAIVGNHYKGNHRNLSYTEEEALLEPFREKARAGQIVEVKEITRAYEEAIGRSVEKDHGRIYRVLARHKWRKVMPRSRHPKKASDEVIEASKKLTLA